MDKIERILEGSLARMRDVPPPVVVGEVVQVQSGVVEVLCPGEKVRLGDRAEITSLDGAQLQAEVVRVAKECVFVMPESPAEGVSCGDYVWFTPPAPIFPDETWLGRLIDPDGQALDGWPLLRGEAQAKLRAAAPDASHRREMGERLHSGYALFDALLPIVRGQRLGVFAGSGVGKSTLLAGLARALAADVVVIGLVGERGREVRHFVEHVLGEEGMRRSVVVAATSDQSAQKRRRCAWTATAVAEHFRKEGKHVLLMIDSVTRFAESHREVSAMGGEAANLRGFPASTPAAIAALCERAGPGPEGEGDITAIYSVLVAGSDMEEPVADMLRGVLDGHLVLSREIAEAGRFPAVDMLRSVSRALPAAATPQENLVITEVRQCLSLCAQAELMVRAGIYEKGHDAKLDRALEVQPELLDAMTQQGLPSVAASFGMFRKILARGR